MDISKKAKHIIWGILHPSMNRKANVIKDYFDQRSSPGSPNLHEYADVTSPIPEQLNNHEVVGALLLFLFSENTPIPILVEKYVIHDTWEKRFNESFFIIAEEVARDFQIKGFTVLSLRLLGYCGRVATIFGRPEFAERFKEKNKSIFRGRHPRRQP